MNKFYTAVIILFILVGGLSSCQKDQTTIPASLQMPGLTGKWYLRTLYIRTSTDASPVMQTDSATSFTNQDYFEFKANNAATYSSTIIGKSYDGYYSTDASATPATLTFKSVSYLNKFYISQLTANQLIIYQTQATTVAGVTTTVANYYVYKH